MIGYYYYLWSTTWPNMIVLLLIWGIVLSRMGWKILRTWRYARDVWGFSLLTGKIIIWIAVLGVYTELLLFSQPDWLSQPGHIQGVVKGKAYDSESSRYFIDVRSGTEQKQFYIDASAYEQLKLDDQVKLMYLPSRREVVRCELMGSSH